MGRPNIEARHIPQSYRKPKCRDFHKKQVKEVVKEQKEISSSIENKVRSAVIPRGLPGASNPSYTERIWRKNHPRRARFDDLFKKGLATCLGAVFLAASVGGCIGVDDFYSESDNDTYEPDLSLPGVHVIDKEDLGYKILNRMNYTKNNKTFNAPEIIALGAADIGDPIHIH